MPQAGSAAQFPHLPAHTAERQSAWVTQVSPATRPHLLSATLQMPERQEAFVGGGPQVAPFLSPHRSGPPAASLVSQKPEAQTRVPLAGVQAPLIGADVGRGCPFAVFSVQTPVLHHSVPMAQVVSSTQAAPHAPVVVLQTPPLGCPAQSGSLVHFPQLPAFAPVLVQKGAAAVGHGCAVTSPLSPVQAAHVFVAVSQDGVVPVHAVAFVAVHCPHAPVARHAGVVAVVQGCVAPEPRSPLHAAHVCVVALHEGVVPEQALPFAAVHWVQMPFAQIGFATGHCAAEPEPLSPSHWTHAPFAQTGNAPEQSAGEPHGKHADAPPGGFGQLLPPFTVVPRHVHGFTVVRLPQNCPTVTVVHVPFTSPGTAP